MHLLENTLYKNMFNHHRIADLWTEIFPGAGDDSLLEYALKTRVLRTPISAMKNPRHVRAACGNRKAQCVCTRASRTFVTNRLLLW